MSLGNLQEVTCSTAHCHTLRIGSAICTAATQLLDEAALYEQYTRVISTEPSLNEETEDVCALLKVN